MPTTYKVLGQVSATAAAATTIRNSIVEPTFESMTTNTLIQGMGTADYIESISTFVPNWNKFGNTNSSALKWGDYLQAVASVGATVALPLSGQSMYIWVTGASTYNGGICVGPIHNTTTRNPTGTSGGGTGSLTSSSGAIPVTAGTTYYYGTSVLLIGSSARTFYLDVAWYTANLTHISWATTYSANASSNTTWARHTTSATAPANAAYAVLYVWCSGVSSRGVAFDNIHFSADSTTNTAFPTPSTTNTATTAPFTTKLVDNWSGTANASTTISTYAGAPVDLYTVPSSTQTVVSTVSVANLGNTATAYRIAVVPSGQTLAKKNFIVFDAAIPANSTEAVTIGMTLATGDVIKVASDSADVSFTAFGSELS